MFKVFYSWQSDLPAKTNRNLILTSLEKACSKLTADGGIAVEAVVDRDTLGLSGAPDISNAILSKIQDSDAFVADVSIINAEPESSHCRQRPTPNPNVLVELGYAISQLGTEAIVLVANQRYGQTEQLPFDLRSLRVLTYSAAPGDVVSLARKELCDKLRVALRQIASTVRGDPVYAVIYPRTLQVTGQAEGLIRDMINSTGHSISVESLEENDLNELCKSIDPNGKAPLTLGGNPKSGFKYANWIQCMAHWRHRSRRFTSDILVFSPFLSREHVALLAMVEQCSYFSQIEQIEPAGVGNADISWLSKSIWEYWLATRRLKNFAAKTLARRGTRL